MKKTDFEKILVKQNVTVKDAMQKLDVTSLRILYVIDDERHLVGSLTDGDIRRCMLKGNDLNTVIVSAMNSNPKFVYRSEYSGYRSVSNLLRLHNVDSLPILDENGVIIDVIFLKDLNNGSDNEYPRKSNQVFILAGGMGVRLEPFTKVLPKPLVPVGDCPIIEKIMDKFADYGYSRFIISLFYKGDMIKSYLSDEQVNRKYDKIRYVKETQPLGTIGSLDLAREMLHETFFITNSDILVEDNIEKIHKFHTEHGADFTAVGCVKNSQIPYGVLNMDESGYMTGINEKPTYTHVVNTGLYVAEPNIIQYIKPNQRLDITDLMDRMLKDGKKISIYPVFEHQWFDIGQWAEFERTRKQFEI